MENNKLDAVTSALKGLTRQGGKSPPSKRSEKIDYFCVEDTFLAKDITVTVDGLEKLTFPLTEDGVLSIINISSKAKFGRNDETLMDTTVGDTQVITQDKIKVEINEQSLADVFKRMSSALYLSEDCKLVPYFYNVLVHGPGKFFKKHRASKKIKSMIATLVIVLPSAHEGGDLIVEHRNKQHIFFESQNPDFIKCIVFYADCFHQIRKVTKGYRVALTYNVVLESLGVNSVTETNEDLFRAVEYYFSRSSENIPDRIVCVLNHGYTEHSLKWDLLKGTDRIQAYNLVAVGRTLELMPYLALIDIHETRDLADQSKCFHTNIKIKFCVDDLNFGFKENITIIEDGVCFTKETALLVRACVILCPKKWEVFHGAKCFIDNLHNLITERENKCVLVKKINENKDNLLKSQYWNKPLLADKLFQVVIYLDNKEIAVFILSKLGNTILKSVKIDLIKVLDRQFDEGTWDQIIDLWVDNGIILDCDGFKFIQEYLKTMGKSPLVQSLLKALIKSYTNVSSRLLHCSYDFQLVHSTSVCELLNICCTLEISSLVDVLIGHVIYTPLFYTPEIVLEMLIKLHSDISPQHFSQLEVLRDSALDSISILDCANWTVVTRMPCVCQLCTDIINFCFSKTRRRYELPGPEAKRKHVMENLCNPFIKYKTEKKGGPPVLVIEKDESLLESRKALLNIWLSLKERLDLCKFENASQNANLKETKVDEEPDAKRHKP